MMKLFLVERSDMDVHHAVVRAADPDEARRVAFDLGLDPSTVEVTELDPFGRADVLWEYDENHDQEPR